MREICWHSRVKQPICEDTHADGDSYEKRKPYRGDILNGLRIAIAAFCPLRSSQLLRCHREFPPSPEGNARDCSVVPLRHSLTTTLAFLPDSLHTLARAEAQRAVIFHSGVAGLGEGFDYRNRVGTLIGRSRGLCLPEDDFALSHDGNLG